MKKHRVIGTLFCIILTFLFIVGYLHYMTYPAKVIFSEKVFYVEVADNEYLLEKGLSNHVPLEPDEGMFFVFEKVGNHGFWMKDMLFPIDIVWFDENLKVIHIEKSVSPKSYPKVFVPDRPAKYVLEVAEGQVSESNIKIGDTIKISGKY